MTSCVNFKRGWILINYLNNNSFEFLLKLFSHSLQAFLEGKLCVFLQRNNQRKKIKIMHHFLFVIFYFYQNIIKIVHSFQYTYFCCYLGSYCILTLSGWDFKIRYLFNYNIKFDENFHITVIATGFFFESGKVKDNAKLLNHMIKLFY
jgi:hypothetical protein